MQLNRSTDYAIQMLVYLTKAGKTVSSSKLAAAMGVSHRYLLQISAKLRAAGFIRAAHGPSGGLNKGLSCRSFTMGRILSVIRLIVLSEISMSYNSRIWLSISFVVIPLAYMEMIFSSMS